MKTNRLVAVLALVLATACLDFEKQTMTARYYEKTDIMVILQHYEGIFGSSKGRGLSGSEREELNGLLNGQRTYFFDTWLTVYDPDQIKEAIVEAKAEIAKGDAEVDGAIVERQIVLFKLLLANVKIVSGPFYLNQDGKLSAMQQVTIRNVQKILKAANVCLRDSVLAESNHGDLDEASWVLLRKSAGHGFDFIQLKGNQLRVRMPMTAKGFKKIFHGKDNIGGELAKRLVKVVHADELARLTLGQPKAAQIEMSVSSEEKEYLPNAVETVRVLKGLAKDFDPAKYKRKFFADTDKKYSGKR